MDPEQTLGDLRSLALAIRKDVDSDRLDIDYTWAADHMSELFCALDGWLTNGGFKPEHWA